KQKAAEKPARKKQAAAPAPAPVPALDAARRDGNVTIAGRVVSAQTGEPLEGVQVQVSSSPIRTLTDSTGGYAIPLTAAQAKDQSTQLEARRLGFERRIDSVTIIQAPSRDTVRHDVALAPAPAQLDQVVVSGSPAKSAPRASSSVGALAGIQKRLVSPGCFA